MSTIRRSAARLVPAAILLLATIVVAPSLASAEEDCETGSDAAGILASRQARQRLLSGDLAGAEAAIETAGDAMDPVEKDALRGLIALQREQFPDAAARFERVIARRPNRTAVWLYLGQARVGLEDDEGALEALDKGAAVGRKLPGYFLLRSRTEQALKRPRDAYVTLEDGLTAFPDDLNLLRERSIVLLELGLTDQALATSRAYLEKAEGDSFAWLVAAETLSRAGLHEKAAHLLEETRLRFPDVQQVRVRLAHAYAGMGHHGAAGRLFAELTWEEPKYAYEAADELRVAGAYGAALRSNALVGDPEKKLRQRLTIHLESGRFLRALAMRGALVAASLTDEPRTRYLLAYAAYAAGRYRETERILRAGEGGASDLGRYADDARRLRKSAREAVKAGH